MQENIVINIEDLTAIEKRIPAEDFINAKYDVFSDVPLTDILIILSTPRSGSTFFSDLIRKNNICIPHEYFQTCHYIPLMGRRWGCIDENGFLNREKYISCLIKYRTSPKGWLGLNLHGEHLETFAKIEMLLPDVNFHFVHIERRNKLLQAISFYVASQTGKWSSYFDALGDAEYTFDGIKRKLHAIHHQNVLIQAYLNARNHSVTTLCYEDLIASPETSLKGILPAALCDTIDVESNLQQQSSIQNKEWFDQFSNEYYETLGQGYSVPAMKKLARKVAAFYKQLKRGE